MQDYARYDIKDFLADEPFCRWVLHQKPADCAFWQNWLQKNPDRADIVRSARELISEIHHAQHYLTDEELQQELSRLTAARKAATEDQTYSEPPRRSWFGKFALVLTALFCVVGFWYFYTSFSTNSGLLKVGQKPLKDHKNGQWTQVTNNQRTPKSMLLPDGSKVTLSPRSRISYPLHFEKKQREVLLNGEAFFDVIRNPQSPFKVYTSDLVTTVLGTSFTVKAFDQDKDVRVVVKTGRVTVAATTPESKPADSQTNQLILRPNQQVIYHREDQKMKRSLIENPLEVGPAEVIQQNLVFENAPVASVFDSLQKRYEVQIIYDADLLAHCQLTAELGQEPLFEKLGMICKAIQARYELIDGQIVIHGSSCK
ncbi:FecR family protein [Larkinella arboricola]|uniref:FecR family protein n=1 Tax=Larkinella arboricola TaxID=643671 RepID=A0A327WNF7_LARAB|nr:FecR family protein [Larkinella arboricola]RAJ93135.1 FecR family protein [Larkinella arboricola]